MDRTQPFIADKHIEVRIKYPENTPVSKLAKLVEFSINEKLDANYLWESDLTWIPEDLHEFFVVINND